MRKLSMVILGVSIFTMSGEILNQFTTLTGWSHGFHENDPTARYLLSVNPILETLAVFAIPTSLILFLYFAGVKWTPTSDSRKRLQGIVTFITVLLMVLLGISTFGAAISDLNTLHAHSIL